MSGSSPVGGRSPRGGSLLPGDPDRYEVSGRRGTRLQAYRWEPREGALPRPAVFLVHGLGEHAGRYAPLLEALLTAGHPVVAFDQRGHGASDGRRGVLRSFDHLVDDVFTVAGAPQACLGPGSVLFGHSLGGLVAIRALQRGDRSWGAAVLSAPWLATRMPVPLWKRAVRPLMLRVAPRWTLPAGVRGEHLTRDPERQADRARDPAVHDRVSAGLAAQAERAQQAALHGTLPRDLPVLVIAPGEDPLTDVPVAVEWARGTEARVAVTEVPDARHEPHNDRGREALFGALLEWLASQARD
ncbi:MAG: lysophospholipase [Gemmatimonadetes bacterium]|nr:lysophospholipase [Gemmatimonadota bacterium]